MRGGGSSATAGSADAVVLDSGGCTVKLGLAASDSPAAVFPNCLGKGRTDRQWMIGDTLLEARDISGLSVRRPVDRGFVVNFELQQEVWARGFEKVLQIDPRERTLLLTEPPFNLDTCRDATAEILFEGFGFQAVSFRSAAELALHHANHSLPVPQGVQQAGIGLVLDCGFSFTHTIPVFDGKVLPAGVRRLNLGGKAITNLLKEMVSYRSLNMMDETYLMEVVKDNISFISSNAPADLVLAKQKHSPLAVEYVLPDGVHNLRGFTRDLKDAPPRKSKESLEQTLTLANERFMPMEALFRPPDIGLQQAGVAELVKQAVEGCPPQFAPLLYSNVVLAGGLAKCPGFKERLEAELRPLVPCDMDLQLQLPKEPDLAAWRGGVAMARMPSFSQSVTTRAEYEEHGCMVSRREAEA
mmetsp:Transcript_30039/g.84763  ORF Transcript_30039/g.84763 Transcript_30039/m.84763 type:complete len:413 (-) Transcript_30039:59-1297(-)